MMEEFTTWYDNFAEWFKKHGFRVSIVLAVLIFFISVYHKGTQYFLESRYASKDIIYGVNGSVVKIVYPSVLQVIPSEKAQQQISVDVTGYPVDAKIETIVDFSGSKGLIFHDLEGNVVSSIIILDASKADNGAGVFVLPEPLQSNFQQDAYLKATITAKLNDGTRYSTSRNYRIEILNASGFKINYWFDPFLEDGIAISFALALAGWAIDYRNKYKEEEAKNRQIALQSLKEIAKTDPAESMQRLFSHWKEKWDKPLKSDLAALKEQFQSKQHMADMFYRAGEAIEQEDFVRCEKNLKAIGDYLAKNENLKNKDISVIRRFIKQNSRLSQNEIKNLMNATLSIWKNYDEDVRKIVVYVIRNLYVKYENNSTVIEIVNKSLKEDISGSKRQSLLQDPGIKPHVGHLANLDVYSWNPIPLSFPIYETNQIKKWLDLPQNSVKVNPFKLQDSKALFGVALWSEEWDSINLARPNVLTSDFEYDRELLIRYIEFHFQENAERSLDIFPVSLRLDLSSASPESLLHVALTQVLTATAFTWFVLTGKNPSAFLNLYRNEQYNLAEFLIWIAGSPRAAQLRLKQNGLQNGSAEKMIFKRINEFPEKVLPESYTTEKKYEWLSLKPPSFEQTYVLVDLQFDKNRHKRHVEQLLALAQSLYKTKTVLKIFTAPVANLSSHGTPITIRWSDKFLVDTLDKCIVQVSDNKSLKFSHLFWPEPNEKASNMLVVKANGSLSELLRLGNEVIRHHVEKFLDETDNSPEDPYLDISDVESAK